MRYFKMGKYVLCLCVLSVQLVHARVLAPITLVANGGSPGEINLRWTSLLPNYWYQIQRSYNGLNFFNISNAGPGTTRFTDSGLNANLAYSYRLIAYPANGSGLAERSNIVSATSPTLLPNPYPIFQDSFDSRQVNPAWILIGDTWKQKAGVLQRINNAPSSNLNMAILNDAPYPPDQTITAKVRVTDWSKNHNSQIGVGIYTDPNTGKGYELVFHGEQQLQFLNPLGEWGQAFPFTWKRGMWYWFKLTLDAGTLKGKVWEDGTPEPSAWQFMQSGWNMMTTGSPALDGGRVTQEDYASAVFDSVSVTGTLATPTPFAINTEGTQAKFHVTTFATGLNYPYGMQELSDHSLLVATSDPASNGNYFKSTGTLLRFTDVNQDGIADGPGEIKVSGLPGTLTGLHVIDDLVFVTSSQPQKESIWVLRMGLTPEANYIVIGSLNFTFPPDASHSTSALTIRSTPGGSKGEYELFFNIGSQQNVGPDKGEVILSGLASGTLQASSLYMIKVKASDTKINFHDLTQVARGLRNAAGMTFDKENNLLIEDNGIDYPTRFNEPLSADTLYFIPANKIGVERLDFGFPDSYILYRTNKMVGSLSVKPLVAFQPWSDPYTGAESEGPAEIALAPTDFPDGFNEGVFIGFHGRFNLGGRENEENPVVFYNKKTGNYFHFISNREPNIGHLDGLLSTKNALYIADLSKTGNVTSPQSKGGGGIYKITSAT